MKPERVSLAAGAAMMVLALLYGCASFPTMTIAPKDETPGATASAVPGGATGPGRGGESGRNQPIAVVVPGGAPERPPVAEATAEQIAAIVPDEPTNATLPPQPLLQYLNTAFTEVLRVPYSLAPGVETRTDIITLNAPANRSKRDYVRLLQAALRNYGLTLSVQGGGFIVSEAGAAPGRGGQTPVIRSRSSADTPAGARQVMQFFQLVALQAEAVLTVVKPTFDGMSVRASIDPAANAIMLQGSGRNVAGAVDLLRNLDQPAFSGAQVVRLEPVFWAPDAFSQALAATLTAEGYIVSTDPLGPKSIMIVPLATTNQTLVFAADRATMARVQYWARELDQPSGVGDQSTTFVYEVRNTSASTIGAMLVNAGAGSGAGRAGGAAGTNQALAQALGLPGGGPIQVIAGGQQNAQGGRGGGAQNNANAGRGGGAQNNTNAGRGGTNNANAGRAAQAVVGSVPTGGTITVDDSGNRILFTGSASQFASLRSLLQRLDVPAREVVVEVTVAEVTLTDETRSGVEFFFDFLNKAQERYSGGTMAANGASGLNRGAAGLNVLLDRPNDYQIALNAFASNNKVNILSRPRLTARSGAAASIQVGADVPIVIGQRAVNTGNTNDTSADVTQQIQYRQTGVILNITPIIYGDDRVDLQIYQEVSADRENPNPAIQSPIIDARSVSTTLSLADGQTAVLGGLIEDTYGKSNRGIPFLKDIPVLGYAFRTDQVSGRRTELVLLITPFIIRNDADMNNIAGQMSQEINDAFKAGRGGSYTLTPYAGGTSLAINPPDPNVAGASLRRPPAAEQAK